LIELSRCIVSEFLLHGSDLLCAATGCFASGISEVPHCLGTRCYRALRDFSA
jgi:hypothetical protein